MTMTDERLAELDAVMATVTAAFPITSRDTADYAEITFGSSQTQAMSMEPATLLAINDVFAAIPDLRAHIDALAATIVRLREALNEAAQFIEVVASADFDEIAADGGVDVGMVIQKQAATVNAPRARAALTANHSAPVVDQD